MTDWDLQGSYFPPLYLVQHEEELKSNRSYWHMQAGCPISGPSKRSICFGLWCSFMFFPNTAPPWRFSLLMGHQGTTAFPPPPFSNTPFVGGRFYQPDFLTALKFSLLLTLEQSECKALPFTSSQIAPIYISLALTLCKCQIATQHTELLRIRSISFAPRKLWGLAGFLDSIQLQQFKTLMEAILLI